MRELVSVVITTYKRPPEMIAAAIESVLNQTYENIELFIVDDSPEDYSERVRVKEYCESIDDRRVKYVQHIVNQGACVARNTGMNLCNGSFISFLDDDDEYLPTRIERMLKCFDADDIVMVYCDAAMFNNGVYRNKNYSDLNSPHEGYVYDEIMKKNFIGSTSMVVIRTDILKSVGGFNPEMEASQDWETWTRVSQKGRVAYCSEVLFNYYAYDGDGAAARISNNTKRRIRALQHLNEIHRDYLIKHKNTYAIRKEYEMRLHIQSHDIRSSLGCYLDIIKLRPIAIVKNIYLLKAFGRWVVKK